jgi:hypothetical protein
MYHFRSLLHFLDGFLDLSKAFHGKIIGGAANVTTDERGTENTRHVDDPNVHEV